MATVTSACGVLCSECPAYLGKVRGAARQKRTAAAWRRIQERVRITRTRSQCDRHARWLEGA
jgi:hypothetical protein